ncbi:adenine deaminase C-terminal domain-containing protein [Camelliibacillus cellulosilyticus]|uniref:adenine deaminase n=1 Tax=Camelliibacillus cellulosilyticus TaxID=2174486 RepID=A0ABV9GP66_9BACL
MSFHQPWDIQALRKQTAVVNGIEAPTKVLRDAEFLNAYTKQWERGNIWILDDRIVYVGERLPEVTDRTDIIDCSKLTAVPGYIEPHAHPFQLYNPYTLAKYAAGRGTTTLIADNLIFFLLLSDEASFSIMDQLDKLPTTYFWWCRYDAQTALRQQPFSKERLQKWLDHPLVVQGGELTSWPQVLRGDDEMLEWLRMTKAAGKPIEGHLPGASEKTLTNMALLGIDGDHEALDGEEAWRRLRLGLATSLRYSSIRPDLPDILQELLARGLTNFEHVFMTTDGSTPPFYEQGIVDRLIAIALEQGVPALDAYLMATVNPARHYGLDHLIGTIAPGRIAHINLLKSKAEPVPVSVLAKGQWVKRDGQVYFPDAPFSFQDVLGRFDLNWAFKSEMLEPDTSIGIEMVDAVITRPFDLVKEPHSDELFFLTLADKDGKWKISTKLKGFADDVGGFVSSYSTTGDIIMIGKNKDDIRAAFDRMKEIGGGIVLVHSNQIIAEIQLSISGTFSQASMEMLIQEVKALNAPLFDRGYRFRDPIYTLLFLSSIHLPYIRITQQGIYDVMKRQVLAAPVPFKS